MKKEKLNFESDNSKFMNSESANRLSIRLDSGKEATIIVKSNKQKEERKERKKERQTEKKVRMRKKERKKR